MPLGFECFINFETFAFNRTYNRKGNYYRRSGIFFFFREIGFLPHSEKPRATQKSREFINLLKSSLVKIADFP